MGIEAAILGSAAVGAGASIFGASQQAGAAEDAASLQYRAAQEAAAESRRQFDLARSDLAPFRETGASALQQYAALYGVGRQPTDASGRPEPEFIDEQYQTGTRQVAVGGGRQYGGDRIEMGGGEFTAPSYRTEPVYGSRRVRNPAFDPDAGVLSTDEMQAARERFRETPGYQFRFEEGQRAVERSAAARGGLVSGSTARELTRYGQGIASAEFENYANRLAGIAGMGQGATVSTATLGQQSAGQVGSALIAGAGQAGRNIADAGAARASGYVGAANAVQGGVSNYLLADALRDNPGAAGYGYYGGPR